ncbi:unnamed protein product [Medioppia subpectinata]|uniref:AH domain-containing protein n=1 Tax=Medioppia subpectinata TaxID=1979941 RepID=A0A7R9KHI8_9ACAR|nr:unnamed protein product [Medioppia subpectinata]CAG2102472.1 unnamed protein product [Medioppia subpectinata]
MSNSNGIYGQTYDRYVERYDDSTLSRMQCQYWTTKQAFLRKLKRKEDDCIVASDAELDAKLELLRSIDESCQNLILVLEAYQDRICGLAHEESAAGRFLKECSKLDKTRAGKMMAASGKTMCYTAQQRIQLRNPLVRLYQEVETFQYRAVADTMLTVDKMESSRTAYRAALLWMKDVSEKLDPDTYKQLDKFRKVQSHVRKTKVRFDRLKVDTLQKIDLLSASRCNMYSNALVGYQNSSVQFWEKSSKTMAAVADTFKGYQYYEFTTLKELTETSRKLAEDTANNDDIRKIFDDNDDDEDKDRLIKKLRLISLLLRWLFRLFLLFFKFGDNSLKNSLKTSEAQQNTDILTLSDTKMDDLSLLNEILNAPNAPIIETNASTGAIGGAPNTGATGVDAFMPSQLIDLNSFNYSMNQMNASLNPMTRRENLVEKNKNVNLNANKDKATKKAEELSSWFNLFADLDPLANPDAIGKKADQIEERNC